MAWSLEEFSGMLNDLDSPSRLVGLGINLDKTKLMFNSHVYLEPTNVGSAYLTVVHVVYIYISPKSYNFKK